jgi:hypothetical protein
MKDLIARLEAATEGSRELDYLIHGTIKGWRLPDQSHRFSWWTGQSFQYGDPADMRRAIYIDEEALPYYTTSLDAALTLLPKGWFWRAGMTPVFEGWAFIQKYHSDHTQPGETEFGFRRERGTTPALALCIACLKARA